MGIATTFHNWFDGTRRMTSVKRTQDVEPILEANKRRMQDVGNRQNQYAGKDIALAASVPNIVIEQWMRMGVNIYNRDHAEKVRALLNSPEWSYLKTRPGRI